MPTMPASLAASAERLLGRRCLVTEAVDVSAGHAQTVQALRRALTQPGGLDRRAVATHAYWATGRRGL